MKNDTWKGPEGLLTTVGPPADAWSELWSVTV